MESSGAVVLSVNQVTKSIHRIPIIKGISFDVREGEIFGFLGPNGSGKTTTIRMLVDLIRPTSGSITLCGKDVHLEHNEALQHVGCIVENPEMYSYMTGWENLEHFARMMPNVSVQRLKEVVAIVGLDQRIHDKVKTYSLGMRQRLGIAQALLGNPKLLILDEPTNGLDPQGIKELRAFIRELADTGMSLFVSSHLLTEIQAMCDRVAIINCGEVIAVGSVEELLKQAGSSVVWSVDQPNASKEVLKRHGAVFLSETELEGEPQTRHASAQIATQLDFSRVPQITADLVKSGIHIYSIERHNPSLEELFLRLTGGNVIG